MKFLPPAIITALTLLAVSVQAQQVSDEVLPEAETALAIKFEALSPEVATSFAAKARGEPILAKDWMEMGQKMADAKSGSVLMIDPQSPASLIAALKQFTNNENES